MERDRIFYRGRVQGVGFRYTTLSLSHGFKVVGWVRNLADGRVEMLVEGESLEILAFMKAIADRLGENIDSVESFSEAFTGEFAGFEIRP